MLSVNDFILLRAIFDEQLHNAIQQYNKHQVYSILFDKYGRNIDNGEVDQDTVIDIDYIYNKHQEDLQSNLSWAM